MTRSVRQNLRKTRAEWTVWLVDGLDTAHLKLFSDAVRYCSAVQASQAQQQNAAWEPTQRSFARLTFCTCASSTGRIEDTKLVVVQKDLRPTDLSRVSSCCSRLSGVTVMDDMDGERQVYACRAAKTLIAWLAAEALKPENASFNAPRVILVTGGTICGSLVRFEMLCDSAQTSCIPLAVICCSCFASIDRQRECCHVAEQYMCHIAFIQSDFAAMLHEVCGGFSSISTYESTQLTIESDRSTAVLCAVQHLYEPVSAHTHPLLSGSCSAASGPEAVMRSTGKQPEPRQHTDTSMNNTSQQLSVSEAQGQTLPQLLIVGKLKKDDFNVALIVGRPLMLTCDYKTADTAPGSAGDKNSAKMQALIQVLHENDEGMIASSLYDFEESAAALLPIHYILLPSTFAGNRSMLAFRLAQAAQSHRLKLCALEGHCSEADCVAARALVQGMSVIHDSGHLRALMAGDVLGRLMKYVQ